MLDGLTALAHPFRMLIEPALDFFQNMLVFPAGNPALRRRCALRLDGAALADAGPVAPQSEVPFQPGVAVGHPRATTGTARRIECHSGHDGRRARQLDLVVERMQRLLRAAKRRCAMGAGRHSRRDPLIRVAMQSATTAAMALTSLVPYPIRCAAIRPASVELSFISSCGTRA